MKKLLLVLAIGAFAACNDSATSTETPASDTSMKKDSTPIVAPMDTTAKMPMDTTKVDTTKKP